MEGGGVLPPELARCGAALLHQQCWCWGCDIRRAEGNLLLAYGFARSRPPQRDAGSSRYTLRTGDGGWLHLWGFGAAWRDGGAATFLARHEFQPLLLDAECLDGEIWTRDKLRFVSVTPEKRLEALRQTARFCRFNACYENWVLENAGLDYRQGAIDLWEKFSVSAQEFAGAWRCLAGLIDGFREALQTAPRGAG